MGWNYKTPGIPEELFERGKVPITKTEVRAVSLAKLRLMNDSRVLDIGCGTGSVTVEAALSCPDGRVVALDRNEEAVALTRRNAEKFQLSNVEVILGGAPEALPEEKFDRIFIGGGSVRLDDLIAYAHSHLTENGLVVVNTILLESSFQALKNLEKWGFHNIDVVCLNIARGEKVSGWMMKAMNPIYIISAKRGEING